MQGINKHVYSSAVQSNLHVSLKGMINPDCACSLISCLQSWAVFNEQLRDTRWDAQLDKVLNNKTVNSQQDTSICRQSHFQKINISERIEPIC